jgi:hypothetical protein
LIHFHPSQIVMLRSRPSLSKRTESTYNFVDCTTEKILSQSNPCTVAAWGIARFFTNIYMKYYSVFTFMFQNFTPTKREKAHAAFFALMPQRDIIMQNERARARVCVRVIARNSNDPTPTPNSPSGEEAMVMLVSA